MAFCDVQLCFNELNIVYSITNECICNIQTQLIQDFHWLIPPALVKTKICSNETWYDHLSDCFFLLLFAPIGKCLQWQVKK